MAPDTSPAVMGECNKMLNHSQAAFNSDAADTYHTLGTDINNTKDLLETASDLLLQISCSDRAGNQIKELDQINALVQVSSQGVQRIQEGVSAFYRQNDNDEKGTPATTEYLAAAEFEPWDADECDNLAKMTSFAEINNPHLVSARLAFCVLKQTKSQMMEMVKKVDGLVDDDEAHEMIDLAGRIKESADFFLELSKVLTTAEYRLFSALAALSLESERKPEG